MQRIDTASMRGFFDVVGGTDRSQAATMVLAPGQSTGGPENAHAASDQWLYVVSGSGTATVEDESITLEPGALLLIEPGETHEITNTGSAPLETVNVYAPPDY
ncbi:cupin domain-containing protein [Salinigranum rubrum]|uniref:Cupin domain-containing protein n=1 Tax=Salinigranum rubrum TaxID=755307 RepID=A0A2I8VNJ6_9EURY|nr:cupin domain-containing protein [Salinigranum rubrum]AUV83493.1 cupin domain-containing protein [Salinigranum rubrum]